MFEDSKCVDCQLHTNARHRCLESRGDVSCKLAIFLDYPNMIEDRSGKTWSSDNAKFVDYSLRRMSVPLESVYRDYIVKCYPKKMPGAKGDRMQCVNACSQYRYAALEELPALKAICVLGSLGCEAMTMDKIVGNKAGADWVPSSPTMRVLFSSVWVGFSPGLLKEKPAEAGSIYRVIWMAAVQAGLNPKLNESVDLYDFDV